MHMIFDIDGTICFRGKPVSKPILDKLFEVQRAGHTVGFASARHCRDIVPVLDQRFHHHLMVGGNGSVMMNDGTLKGAVELPKSVLATIFDCLREHEATCLVDGVWDYAFTGDLAHPFFQHIDPYRLARRVKLSELNTVTKILVLSGNGVPELVRRLSAFEVNIHTHTGEEALDITYKNVDKMTGLDSLLPQKETLVCFGNDNNDLPLFQKADYSVMIGDNKALRQVANDRIPDDDDVEEHIIQKIDQVLTQGGLVDV